MYQPYMALGLVCDGSATGCRPCSHQVGLAYFLTTPVDGARTLHLYDIDLQLKGISRPIPSSWLSSLLSSSTASTTTTGSSNASDDEDDDDINDDDSDNKDNIDIRISHIAACHNITFAAVRNVIIVFNRLVPYAVWHRADTSTTTAEQTHHNISAHDADITVLSMLGGTQLLVSVDADQVLAVWPVPHSVRDLPSKTQQPLVRIALPPEFVVTCVAHPQTYVNKVLLGAKDGRTMLVNVNSKKIIHVFNPFEAPVTALEPAPIVDVVAVGLANGSVHLHNFRVDKTIMTFSMTDDNDIDNDDTATGTNSDDDDDDDGMALIGSPNGRGRGNFNSSGDETSRGIRTLSFRSDGVETLAVGDFHGNLFVWDLNERRLACEARGVHKRGLCYAQFLAGDSLLVSAGSLDNSIKVHVFDNGGTQQHNLNNTVAGVVNDDTPIRILRSRDGHYLPPTTVRFCGYDGLTMVSAGLDRELRLVCAVREVRNQAFSQRAAADKRGKRARKAQRKRDDVEIGQRVSDGRMTLPPVIELAARNTRERDSEFANIVSVHRGRTEAYAWRMMHGAAHKQRCILRPPLTPGGNLQLTYLHEKQKMQQLQKQQRNDALRRGNNGQKRRKVERLQDEQESDSQKQAFVNIPGPRTASCVAMSTCGNYAYVGFSDGTIHSFNLQSGLHQGVFAAAELITPTTNNNNSSSNSQWPRAHIGPVTSLCVDGCGDTLASAAISELPGKIKLWNAHTRARDNNNSAATAGDHLQQDIDIIMNNRSPGGSVTKLVWCETSDLLAVAVTDLCVRVYDARTRALARSFAPAHAAAIVDMCFDPCGRRLVTAALDNTIRTWDLPSGVLANTLNCGDQAPTAVAVCPNGDFLASTHANCLAVKLWVNCERFGVTTATATDTVAAAAAQEKKKKSRRRRRRRRGDDGSSDSEEEEDEEEEDDDDGATTQKQRKKSDGKDENDENDENGVEDYFNVPLSDNIATLSSRPTNVWTVLPHVREMEERNKPIDGVKKGANAPFFLPTVKGVSFQLDTNASATADEPSTGGDDVVGTGTTGTNDDHDSNSNPRPRVLIDRRGTTGNDAAQVVPLEEEEEEELSRLGQLLLAGRIEDADRLLKRSDAKTADSLIRCLSTRRAVQLCGEYLADQLEKATCVELTQGHLHVFLTCHGETLSRYNSNSDSDNDEEEEEEKLLLERLVRQQDKAWTRLRGQLSSVACLAGLFSGQV